MRSLLFYHVFILSVFSSGDPVHAQIKQPVRVMDSLTAKSGPEQLLPSDTSEKKVNLILSKKEKRKLRKRNEATDTLNPYQPSNIVKPPLYQAPPERSKATSGQSPLADLIREIIKKKQ